MEVLFVCSGNIGRSQMAMEFFNRYSGHGHTAGSAGTNVTVLDEEIGGRDDAQVVLQAMDELGIDMRHNRRTQLTPEMLDEYQRIIVMAEPHKIPDWLRHHPGFEYWETRNVNGLPLEEVKQVRDEINQKVDALIEHARRS